MLLISLTLFLFGTVVGSFLNVLIARLPSEERITGRSYCPHCSHQLYSQDLVPLLSFVFLGGKCRYCRKKISWQYPVVEFVTGLSYAAVGFLITLGSITEITKLVLMLIIASCAIVLFFIDLKHKIVPESVVLVSVCAAFVLQILSKGMLLTVLLSGLGAAVFFLIFHIAGGVFSSHGWMGFGDVELAFLVGLVSGWPLVVVSLLFSFLTGALVSITLILKNKNQVKPADQLKKTVPFGPFLILGTVTALLFGNRFLIWYLSFL